MITFEEVKELFKESIDATDTMNQALEHLMKSIYQKGYNEALEQEPCEDAVSRKYLLDKIHSENEMDKFENSNLFALHYANLIINAPSVIPKGVTITEFADKCIECGKQKKGKWIAKSFHEVYCDNCKFDFDIMTNEFIDKMKYCPNCGAKMQEVENDSN